MNRELLSVYRRCRALQIGGIVGEDANSCLRIARTILQWNTLERAGFVKVETVADDSPDFSYLDTWEHISPRTKREYLEKWSNDTYVVSTWYRLDPDGEWELGDSVGGCTGYKDPASPYDNAYVSDLMDTTIGQLRGGLKHRFCGKCSHQLD